MDPKDWKNRASIERRYRDALSRLTNSVRNLSKQKNTLADLVASLNALVSSPEWLKLSKSAALQMVSSVVAQNTKTWREAARKSQRGLVIHQVLKQEFGQNKVFQQMVSANAELISSLPADIAQRVTKHASTNTLAGLRPDALMSEIRKAAPELTETRVRLIARTETAKTQAAVTEVRAKQAGLNWYVWRTCQDARVRSSHDHMEDVICAYSSPPSPELLDPDTPPEEKKKPKYYGPGDIYNCRCYAEPVVDPDFLTFPVKVVRGGKIVRMNRTEFLKLM